MKSILDELLARKIGEFKKQKIHGQKILNLIKGDPLHLIVLNFLYTHKIYKKCVMYGGSALKLLYDLPRMSVDLDFQINFPLNLKYFKEEITDHFKHQYGYEKLGINTGIQDKSTMVVKVTFSGLDQFNIPDLSYTKLKVRLDFNKFNTDHFQQVLVPQNNEYYNFNLRTYPLSTLMASKIAAVLNRVQYGIQADSNQSILADYKGRDIYDLIWYLQRGAIPNLKYLKQKGHDYKTYPSLFKKIKERLTNLRDRGEALRIDLSHLYFSPYELDEWMNQWEKLFLNSLKNYSSVEIKGLQEIKVIQDFDTEHFIFNYYYKTSQKRTALFRVELSDLYIEDFPISGFRHDEISTQIASDIDRKNKKTVMEYAGLFYSKIENFLKRINGISPQLKINTKVIQYSYGGSDPDTTTVLLANQELETCQFEDLL